MKHDWVNKCAVPSALAFCISVIFLVGTSRLCVAQTNVEFGSTWGLPTNNLCAGLFAPEGVIRINAKTGRLLTSASLAIRNVGTNGIRFFCPPFHYQDEFILMDSSGKPVTKRTQDDPVVRVPLKVTLPGTAWKRSRLIPFRLEAGETSYYDFGTDREKSVLNLSRYFALTNPAHLTLIYQVCAYLPDTNGFLKLTLLPPVTAAVRVE